MEQTRFKVDTALNFSLSAVNPWEEDSRSISSIRNSLILAEQMGLKTLTLESDSKCAQMLAELSSSKLTVIQKEITERNKALHQVKLNIASLSQEIGITEFLYHAVIEKRIGMVNQLCTDFDSVLKNMNVLVHRLQRPFVGDHIKIDAAYHRFAKEVFTQLVPTLNDLTVHLDNITWAGNNDFSSSHLEPLLVEIQSLTASVQTSYHMLSQLKEGVEMLSFHTQSPTELDVSQESLLTRSIASSIGPSSGNSTVIQQRNTRGSGGRLK